ncbi:beta-1,3-galactosyltransferase 5-like [Haliotis asinina]|uniref:beta-1,3-galactosyltransferase 5-like n=1 Tax=Haliotis asinina TaxID=109174 RepID=UPI003531D348
MRLAWNSIFASFLCVQICVSFFIFVALEYRAGQNKIIFDEMYHVSIDWNKELNANHTKMPNEREIMRTRHINDAFIGIVRENLLLCRAVSRVDVVFIIHSSPEHHDRREILRGIFKKEKAFQNYTVRHVFLIGQRNDMKIKEIITQEFNQHGDIVQGRFVDSYKNLTYKAVMGVKWISQNCRNVKYVIKMDDDVYVSFRMFFTYIYQQYRHDTRVLCWSWKRSTVLVNRKGKWSVDKDDLKHYNLFPLDYCSGFAVIIPGAIIPALYKATRLVPFLWIDDYFLTGMARALVTKLCDLSPYHHYIIFPQDRVTCIKNPKLCKTVFSPNTKIRRLPIVKT